MFLLADYCLNFRFDYVGVILVNTPELVHRKLGGVSTVSTAQMVGEALGKRGAGLHQTQVSIYCWTESRGLECGGRQTFWKAVICVEKLGVRQYGMVQQIHASLSLAVAKDRVFSSAQY